MKTTIRSLGAHGEGVGELPSGKTVFIEGALPGEEVLFDISLEKKSYACGQLTEVVTPSPSRTNPVCPLFGACGGCHLLHLSYEAQLKLKWQRVYDALTRIGKLTKPHLLTTHPSPMPLAYRNKMQVHAAGGRIGFYRKKSHDLIDIPRCYIQAEPLEILYEEIRTALPSSVKHAIMRCAVNTGEQLLVLVTDGSEQLTAYAKSLAKKNPRVTGIVENINTKRGNTVLGTTFRTLVGQDHIFEKLGTLTFKLSAPAFFQVNSWQAEALFHTALDWAEIQPTDHVIDPFCGVGTLALFAAGRAQSVQGYEIIPAAIEDAKENAALNGVNNCSFTVGHAEKQKLDADILILNPPRKGCELQLLEKIRARRIIYISCDPATLARDISRLPNYRLIQAQPFDLFPQTIHTETICLLNSR